MLENDKRPKFTSAPAPFFSNLVSTFYCASEWLSFVVAVEQSSRRWVHSKQSVVMLLRTTNCSFDVVSFASVLWTSLVSFNLHCIWRENVELYFAPVNIFMVLFCTRVSGTRRRLRHRTDADWGGGESCSNGGNGVVLTNRADVELCAIFPRTRRDSARRRDRSGRLVGSLADKQTAKLRDGQTPLSERTNT